MATNWLRHLHPHLAARQADHALVEAFYSGESTDRYLVQHRQGESAAQFEERRQLATLQPLLGEAVDAVAGSLMQALPRVERSWGSLGVPDVQGSVAWRLETNIDGKGTDLDVLSLEAAITLLLYQEAFALVDGVSVDEDGNEADARVTLFSPLAVPNWVEGPHGLQEVLVKEQVLATRSLTEEPKLVDQWLRVTPTGWERWRTEGEGENAQPVMVASGLFDEENGRPFVNRGGVPVPPVVRVQLPFKRHIARQLADAARTIYNLESSRDSLLYASSFPRLVLTATDTEAKSIVDGLKRGSNILISNPEWARPHAFVGPPTDGAAELRSVIDQKVKAFRQSAWRLYDAEARVQQTATAAAIERSEGTGAILSVLAAAVEQVEMDVLYLLEQCYGDNAASWTSWSEWPRDFGTISTEEEPAPSVNGAAEA